MAIILHDAWLTADGNAAHDQDFISPASSHLLVMPSHRQHQPDNELLTISRDDEAARVYSFQISPPMLVSTYASHIRYLARRAYRAAAHGAHGMENKVRWPTIITIWAKCAADNLDDAYLFTGFITLSLHFATLSQGERGRCCKASRPRAGVKVVTFAHRYISKDMLRDARYHEATRWHIISDGSAERVYYFIVSWMMTMPSVRQIDIMLWHDEINKYWELPVSFSLSIYHFIGFVLNRKHYVIAYSLSSWRFQNITQYHAFKMPALLGLWLAGKNIVAMGNVFMKILKVKLSISTLW